MTTPKKVVGVVAAPLALELVAIEKSFGGVRALRGAELSAALKGANGVRSARKGEAVRVEVDPRTLA